MQYATSSDKCYEGSTLNWICIWDHGTLKSISRDILKNMHLLLNVHVTRRDKLFFPY